jgi:hypothetical protein
VASSPQSFNKRQRERAKKEKAAAKRARRHARPEDGDDDVDETARRGRLLEQFRVLNEQHAAGTVTGEEFEEQRKEIFELLGLGEDQGAQDGADDAARPQRQPVAEEQAEHQAAHERSGQPGHQRHGPVDLVASPSHDELGDPACEQSEEDDSEDQHWVFTVLVDGIGRGTVPEPATSQPLLRRPVAMAFSVSWIPRSTSSDRSPSR